MIKIIYTKRCRQPLAGYGGIVPGKYLKNDLRIIRTRKALLAAIPRLLSYRKFGQITVNDICDEAQLSRAAFYAHFQDKYDFLKYYLGMIKTEIACNKNDYAQLEMCINNLIREKSKIITNLISEMNAETLELIKNFIVSLLGIPAEKDPNGKCAQEYIILSQFCAGGIVNLLKWQINNNFPPDVPMINPYFYSILKSLLWDR